MAIQPHVYSESLRVSPWCLSLGKRLSDKLLAVIALMLSFPLILLVAMLVKTTSRGPTLFRQNRVGKNGKEFELLKFRSMVHGRRNLGPGLTLEGDSRVTSTGRLIRRWKLDELPQLFNVLRGDMSLVGPRPDLAEYLGTLSHEQRQVLCLHPGITGIATLQFSRKEECLLSGLSGAQLNECYVNTILPEKVQLELRYARSATFFTDMTILLRTLGAIIN